MNRRADRDRHGDCDNLNACGYLGYPVAVLKIDDQVPLHPLDRRTACSVAATDTVGEITAIDTNDKDPTQRAMEPPPRTS